MDKRWTLLNYIIQQHNFKSYLEIGVKSGTNYRQIKIKDKTSVDPNEWQATFQLTSDEFFKQNNRKYDLIFIDGLHEYEQVIKDIKNALGCLVDGGIIVCHDLTPVGELAQKVPRETSIWNGDCWKAWVHYRRTRSDLTMLVADMDNGCGIIMKGKQTKLKLPKNYKPNYNDFSKNMEDWLVLCTPEDICHFLHRSNFAWLR